MIRRVLGAVAAIIGGFLIFAQFAFIADPAPGVRWNTWQIYGELLLGVPLLTIGLYLLIKRRPSNETPNVPSSAA